VFDAQDDGWVSHASLQTWPLEILEVASTVIAISDVNKAEKENNDCKGVKRPDI
jgi:hypothetical protein